MACIEATPLYVYRAAFHCGKNPFSQRTRLGLYYNLGKKQGAKNPYLSTSSDKKHEDDEEREEGRRHERERDVAEFEEYAYCAVARAARGARNKRLSPHLQVVLVERREGAED